MVGSLVPARVRWSAVASIVLVATLWIPLRHWLGPAAAQEGDGGSARRPLVLDRAPVRSLEDPNPVFRAVAIDPEHGEVLFANDKESAGTSVLVYPTQFDPTDRIAEPLRRIAGPRTDLGMVCGVAISPPNGELYTVSGETGALNVFPLEANGNVGPARRLQGVMPRASAGVFLDATHDELFITTEHVNRISVYPRTFRDDEEPRRYIQGPKTGLADPHGIYVDGATNEIFVTNHGHWRETQPGEGEVRGPDSLTRTSLGYSVPGRALALGPSTGKFLPASIVVFSRDAHGDAAPLRTIQGPRTRLNLPDGMHRDPVSGELVVANTGDDSVLFFDKDAAGDVAPVRVLKGPATKVKGPAGISIDVRHNELWVANWDNHIAAVFPRTAQGNVAPLRVIRTAPDSAPLASMGRVGAVAYDPRRKEILAPN
jgi:DNA-binding beta-propeller fold protein YncE